jgi:hypothetical protein
MLEILPEPATTVGVAPLPRRNFVQSLSTAVIGLIAALHSGANANSGREKRRRRRRRRDRRRIDPSNPPTETALYPDLQTRPPTDLRLAQIDGVYVLRLTNTVWNAGEGRLELQGNPLPGDGPVDELYQNLYDAPIGGNRVRQVRVAGEIVYHPSHAHYHFADFASYQLLRRDETGAYATLGESTKTSFCITDNARLRGLHPRQYFSCERVLQGLTPGWVDTYQWHLPDQWVVIGPEPLPDGEYAIESIADPRGLLDEGGAEREANNSAIVYFTVAGGAITNVRATA